LEEYREIKSKNQVSEAQQKLREAEEATFECSICLCDVKRIEVYVIEECCHKFCVDCMSNYVQNQMLNAGIVEEKPLEEPKVEIKPRKNKKKKNQQTTEITEPPKKAKSFGIECPGNGCKRILQYHEVQKCVRKNVFEQYDQMLRDKALEAYGDIMWCPTPGCGNAINKPNKQESPLLVCYSCQYSYCVKCDSFWHSGGTCEEFQKWKAEQAYEKSEANTLFKKWIAQHTKPCPRCQTAIEKNGGCNHMTCGKCRYEFCWLCTAKYIYTHWSTSGCRQFT